MFEVKEMLVTLIPSPHNVHMYLNITFNYCVPAKNRIKEILKRKKGVDFYLQDMQMSAHTCVHTHTHSESERGVDSLAEQNRLYGGGLIFQVSAAQVLKMPNGETDW